ncbi:hypothetical protein BGZ81_007790 [Podila clonocystis]|nr:hypothetical protein BGZ81_007790 [Podila clonocystis]
MDPKSSSTSTSAHTGENNVHGLSPVHKSHDELMHMHPHELLQILDERHVDHKGCFEKEELVKLILEKCSSK